MVRTYTMNVSTLQMFLFRVSGAEALVWPAGTRVGIFKKNFHEDFFTGTSSRGTHKLTRCFPALDWANVVRVVTQELLEVNVCTTCNTVVRALSNACCLMASCCALKSFSYFFIFFDLFMHVPCGAKERKRYVKFRFNERQK